MYHLMPIRIYYIDDVSSVKYLLQYVTHPKEGAVNQARLKVTAQNNQPCES